MLETPHALVGIAVATGFSNPVIGVVLAFFSHFFVDMLPHWNWEPDARPFSLAGIVIDLVIAETLTVYLFFQLNRNPVILAASFAAILPDLLEAPSIFLGHNNLLVKKLTGLQTRIQNRAKIAPGILSQVLTVALCWLILQP